MNVLGYMKDESMATVEGCEKSFREMKLSDQKIAMIFSNETFQRLQHKI